jgi:magnesium transporter
MRYFSKNGYEKSGMPPGTLVLPHGQTPETAEITVIGYDESSFLEQKVSGIKEAYAISSPLPVAWININGVNDTAMIEEAGKIFHLHPLHLEDILNTDQRPKTEEHESYLFIIMKMIYMTDSAESIEYEQLSMFLINNTVITFQEKEGDVFDPIRKRIKNAKGRIRREGPDYLCYALIDAVVDNYFVIPEKFGEKIDDMEMELLTDPTVETLRRIHKLKRDMIYLRKAVWPLREVISNLERLGSDIIKEPTVLYLRDVYSHTIQVADAIETFRDMLSGMVDLYMSSVSNKMNETMKVLTIIATIFIPLTFIAGIYGMNFEFIPELNLRYGYFAVILVMAVIALGMLAFFKRKKWL